MGVTVYEVARAAGVSQPTVSQILGNRAHLFRAETRQRVLDAAANLGYRPNASARAISRGRFHAVGLLTRADGGDQVHGDVLWAIQEELAGRDWHLTTGLVHDRAHDEQRVPKLLSEWSVDGLLISYPTSLPDALRQVIRRHEVPSVWINSKLEADCVHPDDFGAVRLGTEHLLRLGHRRIAYLHHQWATGGHYSVADRHAGYVSAMRSGGLQPRAVRAGREVPADADAVEVARSLLSAPADERPTAVVTYGDGEARLVLYHAAKLGLDVPRDLSVLTVRSGNHLEFGLALSTLELPHGEVGHAAVRMLAEKIESPSVALAPRAVPFVLHPGATVGPPPSGE